MLCNIYDNFAFSAQWITLDGASAIRNCALQFYREFSFSATDTRPILRLTAESYYLLYVNGVFAGRGPVRGTPTLHYFDAYDLTAMLHEGKNCIGVMVQSMNSRDNFNSSPAGIGLLAEIPGILRTDERWRVRHVPGWENTTRTFSFQHGYKVQYDFRKGDGMDWLCGKGTDRWADASRFTSPLLEAKTLRPRGIPEFPVQATAGRLVQEAVVEAQSIPEGTDIAEVLNVESWTPRRLPSVTDAVSMPQGKGLARIYDFGTSRIGFFETTVTGDNLEGVRLDVTYGEELWNGRVRGKYPNPTYFFTDSYFLHSGVNHITHPFEMHGATLVQLVFRSCDNREAHFTVAQPVCRECRYPYSTDARFRCSDPLLEKIWSLCCETMSACTTDTFMDCPWREHAFWVNDLLIQNRTTLTMFGASDIHRRAFELAFSQQDADGWVPAVVPTNIVDGPTTNVLPATSLFLFWMLKDYLMASGDEETVRRYLPNLRRVLQAFEGTRQKDSPLVRPPSFGWNFYSWEFELNWIIFNECRESMLNSLYICALKTYQELCGILKEPCDKAWCNQRIDDIARVLHDEFYQQDAGVLEDPCLKVDPVTDDKTPARMRSELSQAFALLSGVWSPAEARGFREALVNHSLLESELYLSGVVFQALTEWNDDRGRQDILRRIRNHWGEVVRRGCTTLPESAIYGFGREAFAESGSLCHGFGTSPVLFFREVLLGITPLEPGYREFRFEPHPLDLTYASGQVFTPNGPIYVSWVKADGRLKADLLIPEGLTARLPDGRILTGACTVSVE